MCSLGMADDETLPHSKGALPNAQRTGRLVMRVVGGPQAGLSFLVSKPGASMGRASGCDLCIRDEGISRVHAEIVIDDEGRATAVDLGSRNGTFLKGQRISSEPLRDGDVLMLGKETALSVRYEYNEGSRPDRMADPDQSGPVTSVYRRVAATLENLGRMFEQKGEHERAEEAYRRSEELSDERKAS